MGCIASIVKFHFMAVIALHRFEHHSKDVEIKLRFNKASH